VDAFHKWPYQFGQFCQTKVDYQGLSRFLLLLCRAAAENFIAIMKVVRPIYQSTGAEEPVRF